MKSLEFKYIKAKSQIVLSKKYKQERVRIIGEWISTNLACENTIFSNEKRFHQMTQMIGEDTDINQKHITDKASLQGRWSDCLVGGDAKWTVIIQNY